MSLNKDHRLLRSDVAVYKSASEDGYLDLEIGRT